ncbi:aggregation-promoting factor C-terminal-like domain-containing protein, partial [Pseudokineococcus marinus]
PADAYLARPGGDEFAVVLGPRSAGTAPAVAAAEEAQRRADEEAAARAAEEAQAEREAEAAAASRSAQRDPRGVAASMVADRGWSSDQMSCLDQLWTKESGWQWDADNPTSSAYGIPQALPGSKMASAGADWETNPVTQITWGLQYIADVYGTPCSAWSHSQATNWY